MSNLKKYLCAQNGNAIIFVVIIVFSILMMFSVSLHITNNSMRLSNAYYKSANLYFFAQSGGEKVKDLLNKIMFSEYENILNETTSEISTYNIEKYIQYSKHSKTDFYDGEFHLKINNENNTKDKLFEKVFQSKANKAIKNNLDSEKYMKKSGSTYILQYKMYTTSSKKETYDMKVSLTIDSTNPQNYVYKIVSTVTAKQDDPKKKDYKVVVESTAEMKDLGKHDEIVKEQYEYRNMPSNFNDAVSSSENIHSTDSIVHMDSFRKIDTTDFENNIIDNTIWNENIEWENNNPLKVITTNNDSEIDISKFYNTEPIHTIIINNTNQTLFIKASENTKSNFKGLIVSRGDIIFENASLHIEGIVIAKGKIDFVNSSVDISKNADLVLSTQFDNGVLKRKILDYLKLTNFKKFNIDIDEFENSNDIEVALNKVKIKNNSPICVTQLENKFFITTSLRMQK